MYSDRGVGPAFVEIFIILCRGYIAGGTADSSHVAGEETTESVVIWSVSASR
jgi:hypothetical protein